MSYVTTLQIWFLHIMNVEFASGMNLVYVLLYFFLHIFVIGVYTHRTIYILAYIHTCKRTHTYINTQIRAHINTFIHMLVDTHTTHSFIYKN